MLPSNLCLLLLLGASTVTCYKEDIKKKLKACKNGAEVTQEELDEFVKPLVPSNEEEKCLMACVLKGFKIIQSNSYNPIMAMAVSEELFKDDPIMSTKAKNMVEQCKEEVPTKMDNECELANQIIQCIVNYEKKVGAA